MKVLIKCLSGATPSTKTLPLVIVGDNVYVELKTVDDVLTLADECGHAVAIEQDETLLVIDDYYD